MFDTIMVATDGSHSAEKAVKFAVEFAKRHDSHLVICTVTKAQLVVIPRGAGGQPDAVAVDASSLGESQAEQSEEILWRAEQEAKRAGFADYELVEVHGENVGATIVKEAEAHGADHIVVGSVGATGLSRLLLGSVAATVIHYAHCPVTVVR